MNKLMQRCRTIALLTTALVLCSNFGQLAVTEAISNNDLDSIYNNTPFYDANAAVCRASSGAAVLNGSDPTQKAFNYFVGQGLDPITTAAIVGNFMEESSGVNPTIVQPYQSHPMALSNTIPFYAFGNAGYGIAQWTSSGRQLGLVNAAKAAGLPSSGTQPWQQQVGDLGVELDFSWQELTGNYRKVLDQAKADAVVPNGASIAVIYAAIDKATVTIMNGYESPDPTVAGVNARKGDAESAYSHYAASATGSTCGSSNLATNFLVYKQCDPQGWVPSLATQAEIDAAKSWANAPYGDGTVCSSGCGPSAVAMAIANLTGNTQATPDVIAKWGFDHGTGSGWGSDGNALIRVFGTPKWGIKGSAIDAIGAPAPNNNPGPGDIQKIDDVLQHGGVVLMRGHMESHYYQGDAQPHSVPFGPFSVAGHFVIIRAIVVGSDGKEKWLVGNPGGWPDNTEYDPAWIYEHTTVHDSWAIYKS